MLVFPHSVERYFPKFDLLSISSLPSRVIEFEELFDEVLMDIYHQYSYCFLWSWLETFLVSRLATENLGTSLSNIWKRLSVLLTFMLCLLRKIILLILKNYVCLFLKLVLTFFSEIFLSLSFFLLHVSDCRRLNLFIYNTILDITNKTAA